MKIAMTMRAIDDIRVALGDAFRGLAMFAGIDRLIDDFARAAKARSETLHTDADIFDVWSTFVVAGEGLTSFEPALRSRPAGAERQRAQDGLQLIADGKDLVFFITRARVPMPKTTRAFIERCASFGRGAAALERVAAGEASGRARAASARPAARTSPESGPHVR